MKQALKVFSFTIISLFILSLFGWMVSHIVKGDKSFGFLKGPIKFMYTFPDMFSQSVEEVKTLPKTYIPTKKNFDPINKLKEDVLILATHSDTSDSRSVILYNLKNDSIQYKWALDNPHRKTSRILNPLLYPNKSIVYGTDFISGLRRIDSLGNVIWKQDSIFVHHAINKDKDGNIWACTTDPVFYATGMYKRNGQTFFYLDNRITKIDAETGRILAHLSITQILKDNNMASYILKSPVVWDPVHINDVQPALKTTQYYKEGDLYISSRYFSFVLHYRPSTNKVVDVIEGPFVSQHDVDFLNDSTLVFFNNNNYTHKADKGKNAPKDSSRLVFAGDFYSNIVRYDYHNDSLSFIGDSIFRNNRIFTYSEGLQEFIDDSTYFVEEQNTGLLWVIRGDEVLYKNVLKSQHEGYHHLPNWNRIIKKYD